MVFSTNHKYHVISRSRPFLFPSFFISIVLTSNLSWPWWSTISKGNKMLVFGEKRRLYPEIRMFAYEQCNCRILYFVAWSPLEAEEKTSCDIYFHLDFSPSLASFPSLPQNGREQSKLTLRPSQSHEARVSMQGNIRRLEVKKKGQKWL